MQKKKIFKGLILQATSCFNKIPVQALRPKKDSIWPKFGPFPVAYPEGFRRRYTGLGAQIMCPNYLLMVEIKFKP